MKTTNLFYNNCSVHLAVIETIKGTFKARKARFFTERAAE